MFSQNLRSFLLGAASQLGINPPMGLPMINVVALNEKKKEEQKLQCRIII